MLVLKSELLGTPVGIILDIAKVIHYDNLL